jgi:uncharacterized protein YceH (UPF0502 family)
MNTLHPVEVRVLGALLEKDITTPEYYPLTVNALVNACNQKSNRDPMVNYDKDTVLGALDTLRDKHLALKISGAGHRVEKYGHRLGETLNLGRRELAVLCVLMLRGAQTVGELRGRTERMHDFVDLDEVEHVLESLATRVPDPLAVRAARGRWAHLLSGEPEESAEAERPSTPTRTESEARAELESRAALEARVAALEQEVALLKLQLESFRLQFE